MDCRKNHCLDAQQQEVLQRLRKKNRKLKGVHLNYKHKKIGKENLTQTASKITDNKVVMTLAYFLDGIYLNHNGICLKWDKRKLVNSTDKNFLPAFSAYFGFSN